MPESKITVKIVEVCKVAPPPPASMDSASPHSLPLTFIDISCLRFPPILHLFFYEFPTPQYIQNSNNTVQCHYDHDDILSRLKHSLSLTLQHFLPLSGNLTWPESSNKPVLEYVDGDDVSFTVAESDADFYLLSSTDEFFGVTEHHPLIPNLTVSHEQAAVMALQVTIFPNCGFSIGIACTTGFSMPKPYTCSSNRGPTFADYQLDRQDQTTLWPPCHLN